MKRLELLPVLALLLLALDSSEASLLARGRSKMKKLEEQVSEAPYVCLDPPTKLPACNFGAEAEGKKLEKPSRQLRSTDTAAESEEQSPIRETEVTHRATTIIYKIEGCVPFRLPFVLPLCKTEDSVGRIVEVRRLFPFKVTGPFSRNSGVLPPLVFPEIDMNQWQRFMQGPWIRPADNNDNAAQGDKVTRPISEEKQSQVATKKTTKRKKAEQANFNDKKTTLQKFTKDFASKEIDENDIFSKFPSPSAVRQQLANDCARDTNSCKTGSSRLNRIVDASQEDGEIGRHVVEKAFSTQYRHEFPYAEAIPYDPEKLQAARLGSKFPYARAIPYDPERLRVAKVSSEFPYNRAVPYDPERLRVAKVGSEFPYNRAIPYDPKKLQVARVGSEFPYARAIPYNPENLRVARVGSEFPYSRAIPFDPAKLQVAKRGSEFPYTRAIPYDPKKLEERRSAALDAVQAKPQNPRVIPFDTSMLDAAKEGGIFPYGKAIPDDTSKIVNTSEFPRSSAPEKMQVPVRHVKTFWNEEFPAYAKKLPSKKEQMRLENGRAGRELQENLISSWNDEVEPSSTHGRFDGPLHMRVTRRGMETDGSGDTSSASDSLDIPSRWSEFPYSKAIPFDPEKLRRPRSSMEYYVNSLVAIPQDFPYAKAIPYDPWKLTTLRRKKSESQVDATMHD